ncbi:MAG: hypothetical protein FWD80_07615, partial [Propionibacteriaceae bacterium]|nr:hypothetical protein [Propionibacteriaceae bacterium]
MKTFTTFASKELLESLRTYRLWIMLVVFLALGILSPLTAKLLPALLNGADMGDGVILHMPDPTAMDAWTQFFKNVSQLGGLVLVIVFCGITATEFSRGTLINILTKGVARSTVVLAKFAVAALIWTLSYAVTLGTTLSYVAYFWGLDGMHYTLLAFISPWLFGLLMLALLILGGILVGNIYGALLAAGGVVIVLNIIGIAPKTAKYNPVSLAGGT